MHPLEIAPNEFRRLAEQVVDLAVEYLTDLDSRSTFPATRGAETEQLFHTGPPEKGLGAEAIAVLRQAMFEASLLFSLLAPRAIP